MQEQRRRRVRGSLLEWCTEVLAPFGQAPARHHRFVIEKLEQVARGEIDRLMIYAPPGSAKSTYATVLFPTWWFTQYPRSAIISASHTGELAESFGRRVRNLADTNSDLLGYTLSADSRAAGKWDTDFGGEYLAAGVGKAIAGRRADLAVIDDPVASREDAESETQRDRTYAWYRGDLYDRLKPGARIILIMTRWHMDDLGGRLDQDEASGGDRWHRVIMPAIAESDDDPLGRAVGEALWPEWEDVAALQRKRRVVGEREWVAKYQQRPSPAGGAIFNPDQMPVLETIPPQLLESPGVVQFSNYSRNLRSLGSPQTREVQPRRVRAWDLAATEKIGTRDPDWTVGLLMCRTLDNRYVIESVVRMRGSVQATEATLVSTAEADAQRYGYGEVLQMLPQDPGQAGKGQVAYLTTALAGHRVAHKTMSGDKATRAAPFAAQVNVGNVSVIKANWNREFCEELAAFPNGSHDDMVDAGSLAFARLVPPRMAPEVEKRRMAPTVSIYRR